MTDTEKIILETLTQILETQELILAQLQRTEKMRRSQEASRRNAHLILSGDGI